MIYRKNNSRFPSLSQHQKKTYLIIVSSISGITYILSFFYHYEIDRINFLKKYYLISVFYNKRMLRLITSYFLQREAFINFEEINTDNGSITI